MQENNHSWREHKCAKLPKEGIYLWISPYGVNQKGLSWTLNIIREATEEDLLQHTILQEIGDHMWSVQAEISHCPYCGEELKIPDELPEGFAPDADSHRKPSDHDFGQFVLSDGMHYYSKMR